MITEFPYFSYDAPLDALMAPLTALTEIQLLSFRRMYFGRDRILISRHHQWDQEFYANELYQFGLFEKEPQELISSYNMWDHFPYTPPEVYRWAGERFNLAHGLTIVKQHEHYSDTFAFATSPSNKLINNFYINQKELFEEFITSFYEELDLPLKHLEQHKLRVPEGFTRPQDPIIELTRRQLDCIILVLEGFSAKEIAKKLDISPRTVEFHLNHLKSKFKAKNKTHLSQIIRPYIT
jgi:DNA-binding CsgD family transcriptional regulator